MYFVFNIIFNFFVLGYNDNDDNNFPIIMKLLYLNFIIIFIDNFCENYLYIILIRVYIYINFLKI